jgi:hypothetical protein
MSNCKLPPGKKISVAEHSRFVVITTNQVTVSMQFFCFLWSQASYVALSKRKIKKINVKTIDPKLKRKFPKQVYVIFAL